MTAAVADAAAEHVSSLLSPSRISRHQYRTVDRTYRSIL